MWLVLIDIRRNSGSSQDKKSFHDSRSQPTVNCVSRLRTDLGNVPIQAVIEHRRN